jgi:hypothetical protein
MATRGDGVIQIQISLDKDEYDLAKMEAGR